MADVFLSYAQEDRTRAGKLADALRELGWDVWWDAHVYVGTRFRAEITRQLHSAKCVVVLWSQASIESDWVIDEAEDGKNRGVLVQALIDAAQPPHGFRGIQWANLNSWSGDIHSDEFIKLADGISRFAQSPTSIPVQAVQSPQPESPAHIALDPREQTPTAQSRPLGWATSVFAKRWPLVFAVVGVVIAAASMLYVAGLPAVSTNEQELPAWLRGATVEQIVDEVIHAVGAQSRNFTVLSEGDLFPSSDGQKSRQIVSAAAMQQGGIRYLVYGPEFFENLQGWQRPGVIAHEVGHHVEGHVLVSSGDFAHNREMELEADQFSGRTLRRMGANLAQAQSFLDTITDDNQYPTHPTKALRLDAVRRGWSDAVRSPNVR